MARQGLEYSLIPGEILCCFSKNAHFAASSGSLLSGSSSLGDKVSIIARRTGFVWNAERLSSIGRQIPMNPKASWENFVPLHNCKMCSIPGWNHQGRRQAKKTYSSIRDITFKFFWKTDGAIFNPQHKKLSTNTGARFFVVWLDANRKSWFWMTIWSAIKVTTLSTSVTRHPSTRSILLNPFPLVLSKNALRIVMQKRNRVFLQNFSDIYRYRYRFPDQIIFLKRCKRDRRILPWQPPTSCSPITVPFGKAATCFLWQHKFSVKGSHIAT